MLKEFTLWPTCILFPGLPQIMRHLEMDLRLVDVRNGSNHLRGDGPGKMFKLLFQLLNRFIHPGPQFIYTGPLRYKIRLENLMINVIYIHGTGIYRRPSLRDRDHIFNYLVSFITQVATAGLLRGRISRIGVRSGTMKQLYRPRRLSLLNGLTASGSGGVFIGGLILQPDEHWTSRYLLQKALAQYHLSYDVTISRVSGDIHANDFLNATSCYCAPNPLVSSGCYCAF